MSSSNQPLLPQVGDLAPDFAVPTQKGLVNFPEYSAGHWCIFFAHPANFTAAWTMYSTFLALKERWFNSRNTKLLALSNEPLRLDDWSGKVRRYIGIYLGAPVVEDLDFTIAHQYGMASGRRRLPGHDRLAFIIDPEGVIRLIVDNLQPSIEFAILNLEHELNRLQGKVVDLDSNPDDALEALLEVNDLSDAVPNYQTRPAYFRKDKFNPN